MISLKLTAITLLTAVVLNVGCFACPVKAADAHHHGPAPMRVVGASAVYLQTSCLASETVASASECPAEEVSAIRPPTAQTCVAADFVPCGVRPHPTTSVPNVGDARPLTPTDQLVGTIFKKE